MATEKRQKSNPQKFSWSTLILPFVFGLAGVLVGICISKYLPEKEGVQVTDFYASEMASVVSPTTVKRWIDASDSSYILVDLRSAGEYEKEHFKTAINIPVSSMKSEDVVAAFRNLPKDKQIIVHCYSAYCTLGRQIGKLLSENGIYVKELTVGWSELRYHWDLWNPGAKVTDGEAYIVKGQNTNEELPQPCAEGEFGC